MTLIDTTDRQSTRLALQQIIVSESLVIAEMFGPWGGENSTLLRNVKNGVSWSRLPCIFHRIGTGTLSVWRLLGDVDGMFSLAGWGHRADGSAKLRLILLQFVGRRIDNHGMTKSRFCGTRSTLRQFSTPNISTAATWQE